MSASINKLMDSDGERIVYTASFRRMIEDHLDYLRNHKGTEILGIRPDVAWRFHGDLWGVLLHYEFRRDMFWVTMRVSGYMSPEEFDYRDEQILVPSSTPFARLIRIHRAMKKLERKEKLNAA